MTELDLQQNKDLFWQQLTDADREKAPLMKIRNSAHDPETKDDLIASFRFEVDVCFTAAIVYSRYKTLDLYRQMKEQDAQLAQMIADDLEGGSGDFAIQTFETNLQLEIKASENQSIREVDRRTHVANIQWYELCLRLAKEK